MALYFSDFDEEKIAFVNPWDTTKKQEGFPSVAVSTFSGCALRRWQAAPTA